MRLKTVTARDAKAALAEVRTSLGPDAILVLTQPLKDGRVRVTAAVDDEDPDLETVLAPPAPRHEPAWFQNLAEHHGLRACLRSRLGDLAGSPADAEPVAVLAQVLQARLRFRALDLSSGRVVPVSGPPGAGKTTTVAKLAARAALAGRAVEVVSTDTERAGGLEPLRALLEPLAISPRAVPEAGVLQPTPAAGADLLLIDTAATNPFRSADVARLSQLIERTGAPPVLVLPAGYDPGDAVEMAETYAALGAEHMIATKLDVARRFGGLLAAADAGLALCDAGIAPTVGRGLRPLSAQGLARLLLHGQIRTGSNPGRSPA